MGDREAAIHFYNQGVAAVNDQNNPQRLQVAYQLFSAACSADPTYGLAWYQHGNNNSDLDCVHAAIADWQTAVDCDVDDETRGRAYASMAWRYCNLGRTAEAIYFHGRAMQYIPGDAYPWMVSSLIYSQRGVPRKAVDAARKALEYDPNSLDLQLVLAFALLFDGKYQEGFERFEWRFQWKLKQYLLYPYPKWTGEHSDLTILLSADQGLGDTLSFARFVPQVAAKCKFVHMHVQAPLLQPFMHMFAHLANVSVEPAGSPFPKADAWTTFVSLPYVLKLSDAEVRNAQFGMKIPRFQISDTWMMKDRKMHIGIAWSGSPLNPINRDRNIPLHHFFELARVHGVALYSLQADAEGDKLGLAGASALIRDLRPYINNVSDTASIIDKLDLVITVESALGHICGAINKECWIPYSFLGRDYRAGDRGEKQLWYPKHRFFQQDDSRCWEPVFDRIVSELKGRVR